MYENPLKFRLYNAQSGRSLEISMYLDFTLSREAHGPAPLGGQDWVAEVNELWDRWQASGEFKEAQDTVFQKMHDYVVHTLGRWERRE